MTTYKGTPIRLSADFSSETLQARKEWHNIFKVMRRNKLQSRILYPARLSLRFDQHWQTSFTTNAKGTSLGRKHRRRKRPTENKPKTIEKMAVGSYISIITWNVNGLNAPTKTGWRKICTCNAPPFTTSFCLTSHNCM